MSAKRNLAHVFVSVTTLDRDLARTMEPRASTPASAASTRSKRAVGCRRGDRRDGRADDPGAQRRTSSKRSSKPRAIPARDSCRLHAAALAAGDLKHLFDEWLDANTYALKRKKRVLDADSPQAATVQAQPRRIRQALHRRRCLRADGLEAFPRGARAPRARPQRLVVRSLAVPPAAAGGRPAGAVLNYPRSLNRYGCAG